MGSVFLLCSSETSLKNLTLKGDFVKLIVLFC